VKVAMDVVSVGALTRTLDSNALRDVSLSPDSVTPLARSQNTCPTIRLAGLFSPCTETMFRYRDDDCSLSDGQFLPPLTTRPSGSASLDDGVKQVLSTKAHLALPVEGATRAGNITSEASIEGEAPRALPVEGATRAPLIVHSIFL